MPELFIRSVDGRQQPALGEVAVYWPSADLTNIYATEGFNFSFENKGDEYSELIEHDAEATAKELLASLQATVTALDHWFARHGDPEGSNSLMMQKARNAIARATRQSAPQPTAIDNSSNDTRLFAALWTSDSFTPSAREVDQHFFTEDTGYTDDEFSDIYALPVGGRWISNNYDIAHQVIRIK